MACSLVLFAGCVQPPPLDKPQPSPVVPAPDRKPGESEYWEAIAKDVEEGLVEHTDELTALIRAVAQRKLLADVDAKLKTLGLPGPKLVKLDTDAVRVEWAGKVRGVAR